jgi:SWI/SNF-related matrix-associated actin-dependent regulator of chromatin subfamily A member 5
MVKVPSLTGLWRRQYFNYVILDEGHIIKERKTQISSAVRMLHYENALILTGTPLQNNLTELWAILNFLYPEIFTISEPFDSAFDIAKKMVDKKKLDMAHALLDTLMIRRLKENVERLMPKKIETKVNTTKREIRCW